MPGLNSEIAKRCFVFLLLLAAASTRAAQAREFTDYEKGLIALDDSRYSDAVMHFELALAKNPNDPEAHCDLGRAFMNQSRDQEGMKECSRAIVLDPRLSRAYANRAYFEFKLKRFKEGFEDSARAIELYQVNPLDYLIWPSLGNRAKAYIMVGRKDLAAADLKRLACFDNLDAAAKMRERGELDSAIRLLDKTLVDDPLNADLWFMRGVVSSNQRHHWQAIADLTRAIRFSPNSPVIYYFRGDCFQQLGMHQKAIEDFTHIIESNPRLVAFNFVCETGRLRDQFLRDDTDPVVVADVLFLRAQSLAALGKQKDALSDLDAVIAFDKSDEKALSRRAELVLSMGRVEDAIRDYTRAIQTNPSDWKRLKERADAFLHLGRTKDAESDLSRIVSLNPRDPGAYLLRAIAYQSAGDFLRAKEDFSSVIKLTPGDDDAYLSRAECCRRLHLFDQALNDLKKAVDLNPGNEGLAAEQRAAIFGDLGEEEKARVEMLGLDERMQARAPLFDWKKAMPGLCVSVLLIGLGLVLIRNKRRG